MVCFLKMAQVFSAPSSQQTAETSQPDFRAHQTQAAKSRFNSARVSTDAKQIGRWNAVAFAVALDKSEARGSKAEIRLYRCEG